jgi:hypothetical protein
MAIRHFGHVTPHGGRVKPGVIPVETTFGPHHARVFTGRRPRGQSTTYCRQDGRRRVVVVVAPSAGHWIDLQESAGVWVVEADTRERDAACGFGGSLLTPSHP